MKEIRFKTKISLINGKFASLKNMDKIIGVSTRPATNHLVDGVPQGDYYCRYKIKKEKEGYIFREDRFNNGICGHAKTIRQLIIQSSGVSYIKILFITDQEEVAV